MRVRALAVALLAAITVASVFAVSAPEAAAGKKERQPYTLLPLFHRGRYVLQLGDVFVGEIRGIKYWRMDAGFDCDVQVLFGVILKMRDCYPVSKNPPWGLTEVDVENVILDNYGPEDIKFTWWARHGHILLIICAVLWPIGAYARWRHHREDMERRVRKYHR